MAVPFTGDFERDGQGYGFHQYTVADIAELSALPTELWPDGNTVRVETLKCLFVLETTAADAVDMEVVATVEAGRKWMRQSAAVNNANPWALQATWYVDPVSGDDENSGATSGAPLQTFLEFTRRVQGATIGNTTVYLLSAGAELRGEVAFKETTDSLTIDGQSAATTLLTSVVNTHTVASSTTNEWYLLTISGVTDMTPYLSKRVRVTSGPRLDAICWIGKENPDGAGLSVTRISAPVIGDANTPVVLQPGDEIVIEDLVSIGTINLRWPSRYSTQIRCRNVALTEHYLGKMYGLCFIGCSFTTFLVSQASAYACCWTTTGTAAWYGDAQVIRNSLARGTGPSAQFTYVTNDSSYITRMLMQSIQTDIAFGSAKLYGEFFGCFDSLANGLRMTHGATVELQNTALIGKGNAEHGVSIFEGARICSTSGNAVVPKLTGALGDLAVGWSNNREPRTWAQTPFWDNAAHAGFTGPWQDQTYVVDNLTQLAAMKCQSLSDGARIWVRSLMCHWTLRTTGDAVVAMERVATATSGRVWEREPYPARAANPWATQAAIYINATTGSDENTGVDSGNAIASLAELRRRTWGYEPQQAVTVYLMTDVSEDLELELYATTTRSFTVSGAQGVTELYSGAVSNFTAVNQATPEWNLVESAGISDWTSYVDERIRVTSGTNTGAVGWVMLASPKEVGLNVARVGPISQRVWGGAHYALTAGDTFVIERLPKLSGVSVNIKSDYGYTGTSSTPRFKIVDVYIGGTGPAGGGTVVKQVNNHDFSEQLLGCKLRLSRTYWDRVCSCYIQPGTAGVIWDSPQLADGWNLSIKGSGASALFLVTGQLWTAALQGIRISAYRAVHINLNMVGIFDTSAAPLQIEAIRSTTIHVMGGLFGDGNGGAVQVQAACSMVYTAGSKPTITNTTGVDVIIGGTNKDWDDVPYVETAKMAGVVEA